MIPYFPKQFSTRAILIYLASLVAVSAVFYSHMMKPVYIVVGIIWVLLFFLLSNRYTFKWGELEEAKYVRKLFFTALVLRLVWTTFAYFFYLVKTGIPFEFGASDSFGYHSEAMWYHESGWDAAFDYLKNRKNS